MLSDSDEKVMLSNSGKSLDNYSSFDSLRHKQSSDEDMIDIKSVSSLNTNTNEQKGINLLLIKSIILSLIENQLKHLFYVLTH